MFMKPDSNSFTKTRGRFETREASQVAIKAGQGGQVHLFSGKENSVSQGGDAGDAGADAVHGRKWGQKSSRTTCRGSGYFGNYLLSSVYIPSYLYFRNSFANNVLLGSYRSETDLAAQVASNAQGDRLPRAEADEHLKNFHKNHLHEYLFLVGERW